MSDEKKEIGKKIRPPIVVVVGHIDHGKTTILDWYRKTAVTAGESGGITQHMGAYEVEHGGKRFTFIDTPGHEAFPRIRARGAKIADIGVLVVAADEGVKAQTREAIAVLRGAEIPFVVALNKTDKPDANPERVKQELAQDGVLVEGYGGQVPWVATSAKTGDHMEDLLETIGLLAEMEGIESDPTLPAEGVALETEMNPRRGISATLLVREGTLNKGDAVVIGRAIETVKIFEDFAGRAIDTAGPSSPVRVTGFERSPVVGEVFRAFSSRDEAEAYVAGLAPDTEGTEQKENRTAETEGHRKVFNVIVKADVFGSLEAVRDALVRLSGEQIVVRVLWSDVGDIGEADVKRAAATRMVTIVGFRVGSRAASRELARAQKIKIITGDVIYDLIDRVKEVIVELIPAAVRRVDLGRLKVLKIFTKENGKQIIGGRVSDGKIMKGARFDLVRMLAPVGSGTIAGLERERKSVDEVVQGFECGLAIEGRGQIEEGDELVVYQEETEKIKF